MLHVKLKARVGEHRHKILVMRAKHIIIAMAACLAAISCNKPQVAFVDFDKTEGLDQRMFNVTSVKCTNVTPEMFAQQTKTTSIAGVQVAQKVLEGIHAGKVLEVVGTYTSTDHNGDLITLSGKVIIPLGMKADRYILVSHYTIGSNAEAPSNNFPLEAMLATMGYIMVFPDYEGYGVTADHTHPYLVMEQSAYNVVDMMVAVQHMLRKTEYAPKHDDIYLMGYSQGGATTMAAECCLETSMAGHFDIRGVFAGGGPYDIKATYQTFIDTNYCGYPFALPIVMQGMIVGNNLQINIKDLLQPWLADKYDEWYESKRYTTAQINGFIGTHVTSEMLNEKGMNQKSAEVAELYKAMTLNSVTSLAWTPQAPVYMFHSMDDDTVPYINAVKAKEQWENANISINFGHYGNHVMGALRFIFTVRTFLQTAQWEEANNMEE